MKSYMEWIIAEMKLILHATQIFYKNQEKHDHDNIMNHGPPFASMQANQTVTWFAIECS